MKFPRFVDIQRSRDMTASFAGYNHKISCPEGQFPEMKNITSDYFPVLSPRKKRKVLNHINNPRCIISKEEIMWIDGKTMYINGKPYGREYQTLPDNGELEYVEMGKQIVFFKINKIYLNKRSLDIELGMFDNWGEINGGYSIGGEISKVKFEQCDSFGNPITYHDDNYYKTNQPQNGDYLLTKNGDKYVIKVYSESMDAWAGVPSTYFRIVGNDGSIYGISKGDGVEITIDDPSYQWDYGMKMFPMNVVVQEVKDNYIVLPGILDGNHDFSGVMVTILRKMPEIVFATECSNRIWGCSKDGREIYASKLGDPKNWKVFQGIATDSWAVTIGSDGEFTGATTINGSPIFFKEDTIIKIGISGSGAHQVKETRCAGVQKGSYKSICERNGTLFYKGTDGVYSYNGSIPIKISDNLGMDRFHDAVGGIVNNKYYISMKDDANKNHLFVYDINTNIWSKEDDLEVYEFVQHDSDLLGINKKDNNLVSIFGNSEYSKTGTEEGEIDWYVESPEIGYSSPDNKYVSKINVCISLSVGANVDFFISYDGGEWEHKFTMAGSDSRTFTVPVIPKRCDTFRYRIVGKGDCKLYSITKTVEEGSDVR